ncbi:MAG: DUF192 domain-containing protein [Terracidiphilus sp.]
MNLPHWLFPGLRGRITGHRPPSSPTRLKVLNVTRNTQLGNSIEVADRGPTRTKGLLGRRGLGPGGGMWIVPCESVHTFGMQFPIDLVYLDRMNRIKKVRSSVPAWRMSACLSAHSVIELPAGTIHETHTESGDILEFCPAVQASSETGQPTR